MQLTTILPALALALTATAAPAGSCPGPAPAPVEDNLKLFGLVAIRSGSPIQYASVTAQGSNIWLNQAVTADCDSDAANQGTVFALKEDTKELFLYGQEGAREKQILFTDRSGMGRGVLQYGNAPISGGRLETQGWAVNGTHLEFAGQDSWIACPYKDGTYVVSLGLIDGSRTDCLGFAARPVELDSAVGCVYN
ncbi:uncharacterized protein K452DRAFT_317617 [Aplosporella prunicola CBS 121167]|uniref:Cell wall protein PhiA n=1 Tax=Aplosporella prunicola CBS 121167 TaxID=1176127 RepID=A0A6A6BKU9_9PEZI|nr:uncharacterized protein K452DRAFT_317617 [Aplosporella prunicola CBS 121167]KAF2143487.1 hypothetical protein K452DRAFT_317617 [Aplosporella prunicola CBS 121167]